MDATLRGAFADVHAHGFVTRSEDWRPSRSIFPPRCPARISMLAGMSCAKLLFAKHVLDELHCTCVKATTLPAFSGGCLSCEAHQGESWTTNVSMIVEHHMQSKELIDYRCDG